MGTQKSIENNIPSITLTKILLQIKEYFIEIWCIYKI